MLDERVWLSGVHMIKKASKSSPIVGKSGRRTRVVPTTPSSRPRWLLPPCVKIRLWPNWQLSSRFTPTRSRSGNGSFWSMLLMSLGRDGCHPCRSGTIARQDRQAGIGTGFFKTRAHQGRIAERKTMINRDHELPIKHPRWLKPWITPSITGRH